MSDKHPWVALAVILITLPGLTQSAKPGVATSTRKAPVRSEHAATFGEPFSAGQQTLVNPYYFGMNVPAIYKVLISGVVAAKKSEYETDAQFDARLEKIKSRQLEGHHTLQDEYTFVVGGAWEGEGSIPHDGGEARSELRGAIRTSYDAEGEMLTVTIPEVTGVASRPDYTSFGWSSDSHITGSHVGQNAFGATKVIKDGVILAYTLEARTTDLAWLDAHCSFEAYVGVSCPIPIHVERAQRMDGDIRVAIGATLTDPYAGEETSREAATIESPYETHVTQRGIYIVPNQLVIYNRRTGEILAQYTNIK